METVLLTRSSSMAGMIRLGYQGTHRREFLSNPEKWIPAVGGALAIECKDGPKNAGSLSVINDRATEICTRAERAFLRAKGTVAYLLERWRRLMGTISDRKHLSGPNGAEVVVHTALGSDPESLSQEVAGHVLESGGREILEGAPRPMSGYILWARVLGPRLLTVVKTTQRADVVLYDYLVNRGTRWACSGRKSLCRISAPSNEQEGSVHSWSTGLALGTSLFASGRPLCFRSEGEEAEALAQAGLDFEVVPV